MVKLISPFLIAKTGSISLILNELKISLKLDEKWFNLICIKFALCFASNIDIHKYVCKFRPRSTCFTAHVSLLECIKNM